MTWQVGYSCGLGVTLALRKAKINAVGVVGLVGVIWLVETHKTWWYCKIYSGKTIEILNRRRGRLVLADALYRKKFKPKFIIDSTFAGL